MGPRLYVPHSTLVPMENVLIRLVPLPRTPLALVRNQYPLAIPWP